MKKMHLLALAALALAFAAQAKGVQSSSEKAAEEKKAKVEAKQAKVEAKKAKAEARAAARREEDDDEDVVPAGAPSLKGKIGVGWEGVCYSGSYPGPYAIANALELRYWQNEKTALKADLAFQLYNTSGGGTSNNTVLFGAGVGMIRNLHRYGMVCIQAEADAGWLYNKSDTFDYSVNYLYGAAGLGFEAFIPAWPCLSVSGIVRAGASAGFGSQGGVSSTSFSLGLNASGFNPYAVGIHYYF